MAGASVASRPGVEVANHFVRHPKVGEWNEPPGDCPSR